MQYYSTDLHNREVVFTARYEMNVLINIRLIFAPRNAVLWLTHLVAGLHCGGQGSIPVQSVVRFVMDNVALGQVILRVLLFSPVGIVPPSLHTLVFIYMLLLPGQMHLPKCNPLSKLGEHWIGKGFQVSPL